MTDTDPVTAEQHAWDELLAARRHVEALRRLVNTGQAGAASLSTAEYTLHHALERARALGVDADRLDHDDDRPDPQEAA